jgi:hypothetical protein
MEVVSPVEQNTLVLLKNPERSHSPVGIIHSMKETNSTKKKKSSLSNSSISPMDVVSPVEQNTLVLLKNPERSHSSMETVSPVSQDAPLMLDYQERPPSPVGIIHRMKKTNSTKKKKSPLSNSSISPMDVVLPKSYSIKQNKSPLSNSSISPMDVVLPSSYYGKSTVKSK